MKWWREESGQTMVITVIAMSVLLGFLALAADVGTLFNARRKVQIAADAGAIAGALESAYGTVGNVSARAQTAATNNLPSSPAATFNCPVAVTGNQPDVCVKASPTSGHHTGPAFVEVKVVQPNPTFFMGMFVPGQMNVGARAVAGIVSAAGCINILDPTASGALTLQGNGTIQSKNCGISVNSDSSTAVCLTGGKASINSPWLRMRTKTPDWKAKSCNNQPNTTVYTGDTFISDPLNSLAGPTLPPAPSNGCTTYDTTTTQIKAANAGTFATGTVCFLNAMTISETVTLNASMYVFMSGVTISPNVTVNVPSGTFEIAGGSLKEPGGQSCLGNSLRTGLVQSSSSFLNITAPTSGTYHGIALMEPPGTTLPLELQFGSNGGNYGNGTDFGIIYAPSAPVYLHDGGGGTTATGLVADTLNVCSSTLTINSYNFANGNASPLNAVALVE